MTVLNLFVPLALVFAVGLSPSLAESCDKLQNQTFKDRVPHELLGDKKLNLDADFKCRASRRFVHCRDKIEFNLKSQKLEELMLFRATPLFAAGRAL